ncbi:DUF726-domain-containing protein [Hesseltinella vesiculosa]|uniref:DUF726-domain-containing protein n=1 Tax=Hesseltinella vesiculosa TaxID=101127 RepID=A0A1X2GKW2_9FUNG|nr:DUF726-domain-containing protein [Hesseltinella vesiculosa]
MTSGNDPSEPCSPVALGTDSPMMQRSPSDSSSLEPPSRLTVSSVRQHNKRSKTTAKQAIIEAWIDHVAHPQQPANDNDISHIFNLDMPSHYQMAAAHQDTQEEQDDFDQQGIQETKDVFTDTQKIAYVGLCAVTSLEVVHTYAGRHFTDARMSADNWHRKLMRALYMHMDVSPEEIKMIESLSKHNILPTDFVHQFTAQGETTTVNIKDIHGQMQDTTPPADLPPTFFPLDPATLPPLPPSDSSRSSRSSMDTNFNHHSDTNPPLQELENMDLSVDDPFVDLDTLPPLPLSISSLEDTSSVHSLQSSCSVSIASSSRSLSLELDHRSTVSHTSNNPSLKHPKPPADQTIDHYVIDLRWTVMCDLFLVCLSLENYDARSRVFIRLMAKYLDLDWEQVLSYERRLTIHLLQVEGAWETESALTDTTALTSTTISSTIVETNQLSNKEERQSRNRQRKKRRYVMIGLATIGGGLILGLSAGLMAPMIAGGLGALLTTVGVSGTSSFLGGATGIGLITGAATLAGSRLGAVSMNKRMKTISTFEFDPVVAQQQASCMITITGWLPRTDDRKEASKLPFSTIDELMGDHYSLFWEPEMLEELGSAFKIFATEAITFSVQQALGHTVMSALMAGLTWPLALTKLGYLIDNPWANGLDRARAAGLILADTLTNRNLGARPVTLVGYSLGARVIFYCLEELARLNAYGLVENIAMFGAPVCASKAQWRDVTSVVSGRFINGYATNDWLLGFLFRATNAASAVAGNNVAGLHPLVMIDGNRVENIECTDLIKGHLSYRLALPKLLKRAGFLITQEEIAEKVEKNPRMSFMKRSGSQDTLDSGQPQASSSKSSLSSGHNTPTSANPTKHPILSTSSSLTDTPRPSHTSSALGQEINSNPSHPPHPHSSSSSSTGSQQDTKDKPLVDGISDMEIIADIIANATAAASSKKGTYSSISSGKASIAASPITAAAMADASAASVPMTTSFSSSSTTSTTNKTRSRSSFFGFSTRSRADSTPVTSSTLVLQPSTSTSSSNDDLSPDVASSPASYAVHPDQMRALPPLPTDPKRASASSKFWPSLGLAKAKSPSIPADQQAELQECGIEVKEIKSTLGKMVVPGEVVNPMPKITLELPQHARINR